LHTSLKERLPRAEVDVSRLIDSSKLLPGINGYPSRAALMTHLVLHAAGAMVFSRFG